MHTEDLYDQPLPTTTVGRRRGTQPGLYAPAGLVEQMPAANGYYPNVRNQLQKPVVGNRPNAAIVGSTGDLYQATVIQDSLHGAERIDQHPMLHVSATWTPYPENERPSGRIDPMVDGPSQPELMDVSTHYNRRQGTSVTAFLNAPGIKYPTTGNQDGVSWTYVQSPVLAEAAYGSQNMVNGEMPDTIRAMAPSPPHGWTEQPVLNSQQENNIKAAKLKQQQPGKQERIANSTYAGQSFGARTAHAGATTAVPPNTTGRMRRRG